jgi:hypothetical protein
VILVPNFQVAYLPASRLTEVAIRVDPSPSPYLQAGWAGVQTWLTPVNFLQCGWLQVYGYPQTFCQIWVNGSPVDTILGPPVPVGSTVKVALTYYSHQWVLWTQAQGQPWTVEWVGTNAAALNNSQFEVATEGQGTPAPPLIYSLYS